MDFSLQYIVQWLRSKAPKAKDPRLLLFSSLYKSSSIDPHSFKVYQGKDGKLEIRVKLLYVTPNIRKLKKEKKIELNHTSKEITVILENATPTATILFSHSRTLFDLSLEEALVLINLYIVFNDERKMKLFQQIIQGE